jgi:fluoride exporter
MRGWLPFALVAVGGAAGSVSRYTVATLFARKWGTAWPYGTLFVNITACLVIGLFVTAAAERWKLHPGWVLLVSTGFVGGYSTFSTYEYEAQRLLEMGAYSKAMLYVLLSNVAGFAAVCAGVWIGRRV